MSRALIISHGQPGDPGPQEDAIRDLAARVGALLPDWQIGGATLAAKGALGAAIARLPDPLIYPFFMAEGWFTRTELPRRLRVAGLPTPRQLPAFGSDPALPRLAASAARQGAMAAGLAPGSTTLLLAAHGSGRSRNPAMAAEAMAGRLREIAGFATVATGFIEEDPRLQDVAATIGPGGVCLPCFALSAGHVRQDIPDALERAGFTGPLLPPLGALPEVPALIARALSQPR
ncbi:CbiX/SirB N-terminal domain-containing protein [Paracoccus pacificus]|uniref:CbiX/SirB N-terminal domain-containing protein n=1 Tax=Paracoccus pacificus TaxID=1463598 RepID=A0ABW4R982_9RHOB